MGGMKFCGGLVEGWDMLGWVRNLIGMGCVCVCGGGVLQVTQRFNNYAHAKLIT